VDGVRVEAFAQAFRAPPLYYRRGAMTLP